MTTLQPDMKKVAFEELQKDVIQWATTRGLIANSNPRTQLLYTLTELGETADAVLKGDLSKTIDGLGDTVVTLILVAELSGIDLVDCLAAAYAEIKYRSGKLVDGVFIKDGNL